MNPAERSPAEWSPTGGSPIHVVAAAVIDTTGRTLIAQRPPGKPLAGGWEFPGGKLEPGEARVVGLARELREELGITLNAPPRPLLRVRHRYDFGEVLIDMWVVTRYDGQPRGLDGQALRWCTPEELATADLLPADQPIVRALRLPERLVQRSTESYEILDAMASPRAHTGKLLGVFCATVAEAHEARSLGADFLAMRSALGEQEISGLCESVSSPVFVRHCLPEKVFSLGASGTNEIADRTC